MINSLQDGSTIEASSGKFKYPSGSVLKAKPEIGWVKAACHRISNHRNLEMEEAGLTYMFNMWATASL